MPRALSFRADAFVESVIWKAEIEGLFAFDDYDSWEYQEETKDAWRALLTELFERHGEDLS
jgi:hypothetical protein